VPPQRREAVALQRRQPDARHEAGRGDLVGDLAEGPRKTPVRRPLAPGLLPAHVQDHVADLLRHAGLHQRRHLAPDVVHADRAGVVVPRVPACRRRRRRPGLPAQGLAIGVEQIESLGGRAHQQRQGQRRGEASIHLEAGPHQALAQAEPGQVLGRTAQAPEQRRCPWRLAQAKQNPRPQ